MRAGDLRHWVTLQKRPQAEDAYGEQSADWVDVLTVPAHVSPLSGHQLVTAQAINAETTHQVSLRYHPLLARPREVTAMRLQFNGRVFDIHSCINVDERNRELTLTAAEGLTNG